MKNSIKLAQVLNEQLCHDFAGSIGAIDICADLIGSTDNAFRDKSLALIKASARTLINNLKFYRYLYSEALFDSKENLAEICTVIRGFIESKNLNIKLEIIQTKSIVISASIAQLLLGFVSLAADDLTHDGIIRLSVFFENGFYNIKTTALGSKLKFNQKKFDNLTDKNSISDLDSDDSREYYIYSLAKNLGYKITVIQSDDTIEYDCIHTKD